MSWSIFDQNRDKGKAIPDATNSELREFLNHYMPEKGLKSANKRAIGQKTRGHGDYLFRADRGAFDAMLDDIRSGRNYHRFGKEFDEFRKSIFNKGTK